MMSKRKINFILLVFLGIVLVLFLGSKSSLAEELWGIFDKKEANMSQINQNLKSIDEQLDNIIVKLARKQAELTQSKTELTQSKAKFQALSETLTRLDMSNLDTQRLTELAENSEDNRVENIARKLLQLLKQNNTLEKALDKNDVKILEELTKSDDVTVKQVANQTLQMRKLSMIVTKISNGNYDDAKDGGELTDLVYNSTGNVDSSIQEFAKKVIMFGQLKELENISENISNEIQASKSIDISRLEALAYNKNGQVDSSVQRAAKMVIMFYELKELETVAHKMQNGGQIDTTQLAQLANNSNGRVDSSLQEIAKALQQINNDRQYLRKLQVIAKTVSENGTLSSGDRTELNSLVTAYDASQEVKDTASALLETVGTLDKKQATIESQKSEISKANSAVSDVNTKLSSLQAKVSSVSTAAENSETTASVAQSQVNNE
ncbi:30S ribosomal protein S2 [Ligilactobacillus equi DPC 6820]|uniref:30S ribosomal protein S2 n=2 Tax=Ligilactobacillus equi TaxID=137357 RepID=V7I1H6_9LACO|nr:30S ribosomal protein S2 [Ligilactobacillus equi DPC 6820]